MAYYVNKIGKNRIQIPIPDDWVVESYPNGWTAWAHTEDKKYGVMVEGKNEEDALLKLKERMDNWRRFANEYPE